MLSSNEVIASTISEHPKVGFFDSIVINGYHGLIPLPTIYKGTDIQFGVDTAMITGGGEPSTNKIQNYNIHHKIASSENYGGIDIFNTPNQKINTEDISIREKWTKFLEKELELQPETLPTLQEAKALWGRTYYDFQTKEFIALDKDTTNPEDIMNLLLFANNNPQLYDLNSVHLLRTLLRGKGQRNFFEFISKNKFKLSDLKDLLCISDCNSFFRFYN